MGWIDDRLWCHPKVVNVSDSAFRVFVNGIAYSTGFSTKGRLSGGQQRIIGSTEDTRRELIEARLWEEADGGDVVIHDWDEHNSKRDARREADRERKRTSRAASKKPPPDRASAGVSAGQSAGAARVDGSEGSDGSEGDQLPTAAGSTLNGSVAREPVLALAASPAATVRGEVPAAEEPRLTDREISEVVRGMPGADSGSPSVVVPIAFGLPRSVFFERAEVVRQRRGGVGLLVTLLRVARAERTAALSAELLASLGPGRPAVVVPWAPEVIKLEEPDRYVRMLAKALKDDDLREALVAHEHRIDELLALASRVRAGDEPALERDTPEQARARWVERHAAADPLADVQQVIDAWDDIDPIERQTLHERAEQLRDVADQTSTRRVA